MAANPLDVKVEGSELTLVREFNAPRDLVFRAYTEPEHLMQWWGPSEWPLVKCTVDLRPGGKWHYCMKSRETGDESWGLGIYEEIVRPERLVYQDSFSNEDGTVNEDLPTSRTVITFDDIGGRTRLTSKTAYPTAADLETVVQMGMIEGITETLGQLETLLTSLQ